MPRAPDLPDEGLGTRAAARGEHVPADRLERAPRGAVFVGGRLIQAAKPTPRGTRMTPSVVTKASHELVMNDGCGVVCRSHWRMPGTRKTMTSTTQRTEPPSIAVKGRGDSEARVRT